jgi:hypothetical protein
MRRSLQEQPRHERDDRGDREKDEPREPNRD